MKRILAFFFISAFFPVSAIWGQQPQNFVTVYNENLALIKQIRSVEISRNQPEVRFSDVAEKLIPSSVHLRSLTEPGAFRVQEQNFEYDLVNSEKILQKYIDHSIQVVTEDGSLLQGTLLSLTGGSLVIQTDSGIRILPRNDRMQISVPELPEGLITRPTLIWQVEGISKSPQQLEVEYLTEGMKWDAQYVGILDENDKEMEIAAWVSIDNQSGATFENAHLKLVAGEIHRATRPKPPIYERAIVPFSAKQAPPQFEEKAFFEYHLYTLQRPTTLKNNQTKQISLFPTARTAVQKKYVFDARKDAEKVEVQLVFKNSKQGGLGMPLPEGIFRIYKQDKQAVEFIGEDRIDHTPKDEDVRLTIGKAFDIRAERTVVDQKQLSRRSAQFTVEIEIRNHKEKEDVEVIVVEYFYYPNWTISDNTHPYVKKSATRCEFTVPVKAQQKATLKYQVTYSW